MPTIIELSADLSAALTCLDRAFEEHGADHYRDTAILADALRAELSAEPAVD